MLGMISKLQDWMHSSSKSMSKLQDVKKTFYRLGGGPNERHVSCECNYRTNSMSSYLNIETKPPEVNIESQMSDRYKVNSLILKFVKMLCCVGKVYTLLKEN